MKNIWFVAIFILGCKTFAADFSNVKGGVVIDMDMKDAMACYQALAPLTEGDSYLVQGDGVFKAKKGDKGFYVFHNQTPYFCEFPSKSSSTNGYTYYNMKLELGSTTYLNYGIPDDAKDEFQMAYSNGPHAGEGTVAVKCSARLNDGTRKMIYDDIQKRIANSYNSFQSYAAKSVMANPDNDKEDHEELIRKMKKVLPYHYVGALHECEGIKPLKQSVSNQLAQLEKVEDDIKTSKDHRRMKARTKHEEKTRDFTKASSTNN